MTADPRAIAQILKSPFFSGLTASDATALCALMRPVAAPAGHLVFSTGDESKGLFLVVEGRIKLSVITADGRELSLAHAGPGDVFGEIASLDGQPRTTDATALAPSSLLFLAKSDLAALLTRLPTLAPAIITFLCARLRSTDRQLEAIALHSIEVRLARFLLATAQARYGDKLDARAELALDFSQGELGLLIGASRPKVNAALVALEEDGAILRQNNKIICTISALRRCSGLGDAEDD